MIDVNIAMSPADEKALLQQGIAAARAGDKASARARFRELTARNFDNELAWLWLASVADTPAHAVACLRRVLQINPAHEKARAALFRVLMEGGIQTARAGDKASAYVSFGEAATLDAGSELVWTWMASTAPSPGKALDALRRVLQVNPSHEQAGRAYRKLVVQRGVDLAQANDPGARAVLLEASGVDPMNETIWLWLARVVPPEESIEYYERVLDINPTHDVARAALLQLRPPPAEPIEEPAIDEPEIEEPTIGDSLSDFDDEPPPVLIGSGGISFDATDIPEITVVDDGADADAQDRAESMAAAADTGADDAAGDGLIVEQFSRVEGAAEVSAATQAATHEEFLVYHGADISTVWAGGDQTAAASAAGDRATDGTDDRADDDAMDPAIDTMRPAREAAADADVTASGAYTSDVDSDAGGSPAGAWTGAAAPSAASAPIAWECPICMSGAPEGAVRCPSCGSVPTLVDPDQLLDTDAVDRRNVLQVVARLKNRKVTGGKGKPQFDHYFTLGLAYVNGGRVTEGITHLRMANDAQRSDPELKAQIDALERRAAQRAKAQNGGAKAPAHVNGKATKPPEPSPVDLPAASPVEPHTESAETPAGQAAIVNGSRRLILVVDDSPTIQKVVSVTLEAHGHEVVTASDGMEALSKLRTLKPDLVLLDITMPHMDGYQLCRILRSNELTRHVPIVMLSGKDGLFDKMRGRMAGAATYITKPFAPSALPPLVEKYCKRVS